MFIINESLKKNILSDSAACNTLSTIISLLHKMFEESYSALQTFSPQSLGQRQRADLIIPYSFIHSLVYSGIYEVKLIPLIKYPCTKQHTLQP